MRDKLPIMIFRDDDGHYYPRQCGGYNSYILPSDIEPIISDLLRYCAQYSDDDITTINKDIEAHFFDSFTGSHTKKKKKSRQSGYVYVLKCENKYKIGYSNNVERRVRELDTRPFNLSICYTMYNDNAYAVEQELHKRLQAYKDTGEWYSNISESMIIETLEEIVRYL